MSLDRILQANNLRDVDAWTFIANHLTQPEVIFNEAQNAGLSVDMLVELAGRFDPGIDKATVNEYFAQAGFDPTALGPATETPTDDGRVEVSEGGDLLLLQEGPLADDQLLFVAGLIEASFISDSSGTGAETLLTEWTNEGLLINVEFNDQDYPNVVVDLSEEDFYAMQTLAAPVLDDVYQQALNQIGYDSFGALEASGSVADVERMYDAVEAQIIAVIKPQYDALMGGQTDVWG